MAAPWVRAILAEPDAERVRDEIDVIATRFGGQFPKIGPCPATVPMEPRLALTVAYWKANWSTSPVARANEKTEHCTAVDEFPTPPPRSRTTTTGRPPTATCPKASWPMATPSPPHQAMRWASSNLFRHNSCSDQHHSEADDERPELHHEMGSEQPLRLGRLPQMGADGGMNLCARGRESRIVPSQMGSE